MKKEQNKAEFEIVIREKRYTIPALASELGMGIAEVQSLVFDYIKGDLSLDQLLAPPTKDKKHLVCGKRYSMRELEKLTGMTRQWIWQLLREVKSGKREEGYILSVKAKTDNKVGRPRKGTLGHGINSGLSDEKVRRLAAIPDGGSWELKHIHPRGIVSGGSGQSFAKCHL